MLTLRGPEHICLLFPKKPNVSQLPSPDLGCAPLATAHGAYRFHFRVYYLLCVHMDVWRPEANLGITPQKPSGLF